MNAKQIIIVVFLLLNINCTFSQNLLDNGSFELMDSCNQGMGGFYINNSHFWGMPTWGSPDLFCDTCPINTGYSFLSQRARSGLSLAGFGLITHYYFPDSFSIYKEYLKGKINISLQQGILYNFRCYLSLMGIALHNGNAIAIDSFGVLFQNQDTFLSIFGNYPVSPQIWDTNGFYSDTVKWVEINGTYLASGGEEYFILGDFKPYDSIQNFLITKIGSTNLLNGSCYYYIDDVAIWPADTIPPPADAGSDTIICRGGKARLGTHSYGDYIYEWWPSASLSNDSGGVVWASPQTTTTYYLQATDDIYTKTVDSVTVFVNNCGQNDTTVCVEQQFQMGSTNNPLWNYQWSPSNWLSSDSVGMPLCIPLQNTNYQLLITSQSGDTIALDSTKIIVGTCFNADAGMDSLICKNDSLQIGMQNKSFIDYIWWPNFMISDTTIGNPVVWPDTNTTYYLKLTDTLGRITYDSVLIGVQLCNGINDGKPNLSSVYIYPNPSNSILNIDFDNTTKTVDFILMDVLGHEVRHQKLIGNHGQINISQLPKGIYLYFIEENGIRTASGKVVVE